MALNQGDIVEVERLDPEVFTVIGLVNRSGTFPYLPGNEYSVMQALAFGGGVNDIANPKYVRVYRQKDDGTVIDATFKVNGVGFTDAANIKIKPGDVIEIFEIEKIARKLTD